jgi:NAD-dependent deacetylase
MVPLASKAGARLVIINAQPTPFDELADAVISTAIGEALPLVVGSRT